MVPVAMIAFDFKVYLRKFLDRVNILVDPELIKFYDWISDLSKIWQPLDIIENFRKTGIIDF